MAHWLDKVVLLMQADTSDLRKLAEIAGYDPSTFYRGVSLDRLETDGQDLRGMEFAQSLESRSGIDALVYLSDETNLGVATTVRAMVGMIRHRPRQEERLPLLLRLILEHRDSALQIIQAYGQDKAKYSSRAIGDLSAMLNDELKQSDLFPKAPPNKVRDEILAETVWRPFSRGMPNNRAALLYYMSLHLAHLPRVNAYLSNLLSRTNSMFLHHNRRFMKQRLAAETTTSWRDIMSGGPSEAQLKLF